MRRVLASTADAGAAAPRRGRPERVCVTGGLGFVGSHICAALAERGYEVTCVDRLSGTYGPGSGLEAAELLAENARSTERLATAAAVRGQRFLLASSSSVYGDSPRLPTPERTRP